MYLRTTTRRNKDGTTVRYLQLAHNRWDPIRKRSVARVLHSLGREDEVDASLLARLVASLNRTLGIDSAAGNGPSDTTDEELNRLRPVSARPVGPCWLLGGIWRQLGVDRALRRLLRAQGHDPSLEEAILLLVTDQVLHAPVGGYAVPWARRACLPHASELPQARAREARGALSSVIDGLGTAVQQSIGPTAVPLVIDAAPPLWGTTIEGALPPSLQGVAALAIGADGLPVRLWLQQPGPDPAELAARISSELGDGTTPLLLVTDAVGGRGSVAGWPQAHLQVRAIREAERAIPGLLDEPGRFRALGSGVAYRAARACQDPGTGVLVRLDERREQDAAQRALRVAQLTTMLAGTDDLDAAERARIRAVVEVDPALARLLRVTDGGLLRTNRTLLRDDARRDGVLLGWCDAAEWPTDELARVVAAVHRTRAASEQLVCRPTPPVTRRSDELFADLALCWLALLLVRCIEVACGQPWSEVRQVLTEHRAIELAGRDGRVIETVLPSELQRQYYQRCAVDPPPRFLDVIAERREVSAGGG